jgi:Cu(I)/Ag(I) efflux system membrane fusion protein
MNTVWVQSGKNSFKMKMVETGLESGDRIEIKSGLQNGDVVVMSGAYLLHSEYIFKKGIDPMAGMKM